MRVKILAEREVILGHDLTAEAGVDKACTINPLRVTGQSLHSHKTILNTSYSTSKAMDIDNLKG